MAVSSRLPPAFIAILIGLVVMTGACPAAAQDATTTAVERLFNEAPEAGWFAEAFRREVSASQVAEIVRGLTGTYGTLRRVSGSGGRLTVELEKADVPTEIRLDAEGRIASLLFKAPIPTAGTLESHVTAIAALPGHASVLVVTDGIPRASHEPAAVMAVGSAAKLAILQALADAAENGRLRWDNVVELDPAWRSLPTGILQDWPEATPLTLATLANLMISISDNTATDALIGIVGRKAVEEVTPRNAPFLTTAEMFKLKADPGLRRDWLSADETGKRKVLERILTRSLPAAEALAGPTLDIEWFMSAEEICALLDSIGSLPAMHINPGVADRAEWDQIAFKGGSEFGVLNLSTRLTTADGTTHCIVATWNDDSALVEERLIAPYRGIIHVLQRAIARPEDQKSGG